MTRLLPTYAIRLLHTAMLLLVLAGAGNIHSHWCLDGQEPAVSVHFENFKGHPEHDSVHADDESLAVHDAHDDAAPHQDLESEVIPDGLRGKAPDQDSQFLVAAAFLLLAVREPQRRLHQLVPDAAVYQAPAEFLPPPRAPPHHSS